MQERASRAVECRAGSAAYTYFLRRAELLAGGVRAAGERVAAHALRAQAGGLLREGLPAGGRAAPKGAGLLELDERGAARQPLEQLRIGEQVSAGGAELLGPGIARVYGHRPGGYTRRVGCYLGAP